MAWRNCSVSLELTAVVSQDSLSGTLDRVSAVYKDFPGNAELCTGIAYALVDLLKYWRVVRV